MLRFLRNIGVFFIVLMGSMLFVFSLADGTSDPFYLKFTKPKQTSLIIGTSRAAIGLQPSTINKNLSSLNQQNQLFNYAFTQIHSPYGKTYFESINSKIENNNKGIHIITVCPWSIASKTEEPEDSLNFRETDRTLSKVKNTNQAFNLQYLFDAFEYQYVNIPVKRILTPKMKLHDDGWLEMKLPMDSQSMKNRHDKILNVYKNKYSPNYRFSQTRLNYLIKTINLLKTHGEVYLVRLPVHQDFLDIENQMFPEFNQRISEMTIEMDLDYFDMSSSADSFQYIDGNHLDPKSAELVSEEISVWIDEQSRERQ